MTRVICLDEVETDGADVFGLRADEAAVAKLFEAVGGPAEDATDRDRRREQLLRQAEAVQEQGGVKLHVCIKTTAGLSFC